MDFLNMLKSNLRLGGSSGMTGTSIGNPSISSGPSVAPIAPPRMPTYHPHEGEPEADKIARAKAFMDNLTTDEMGNPLSWEEKQRRLAEFWNRENAGSGNDMIVGRQF